MEFEPPGIDFAPWKFPTPDREEPISMLLDPHRDIMLAHDRDAGEEETDEVHCVLPLDPAPRSKVLFELLELREDVAVVRLVDELREEGAADSEELSGEVGRILDEGRVEAFENPGIRLEREPEKLAQLPVRLLRLLVFELLRNATE